ncbi:hypothetical protein M422DRAFT_172493 [Sphaerobolus stellatus SS14]|uniref:BRCT domain-containing protein n=1 Tax=Sphaerobolus stellatus (strain SS14) TaxID=990650 RepID=A0A0C9VS22_SPHS4|nr:hypothetical protein M422DRAFT_172493 [Sphaerobolus stellatus SS14]
MRVFAKRSDRRGWYFPGTVSVPSGGELLSSMTSLLVDFDEDHKEDVDMNDIRKFQLEGGDNIHVKRGRGAYKRAEVLEPAEWEDHEKVYVQELDGGPDAADYEVKAACIKIAENDIRDRWNERRLSLRALFKAHQDREFEIPENNDILAGIGFLLTLSDLEKSKNSLAKVIEASGGIIYNDWPSVVSLCGTTEANGHRVVSRTPEVKLLRRNMPEQLFCITDEPRTTPKYLISLALGVPCLSMEWWWDGLYLILQEDCADWAVYILPAGNNLVTRRPACQYFNRSWWRSGNNVPNLLSNPPVEKPFKDKSFLCIGGSSSFFSDVRIHYFFSERFIYHSSQRDFGTFPKVLLAMGASHVQVVTDISYVSMKSIEEFDYTVVDEGVELISHGESRAVDISWIKKCVIAGVEGPVPWPTA